MLKQNIGTHTLLFERLPALITGGTECGSETVNAVSEIKFFYDQMLGQLEFAFCDEVKKLFGEGQDEAILGRKSLPSVVTEWMNRLDPSIHEQLFADGTDRMLQLFLANTPALFSALAMERFISPMPSTALSARFVQTIIRKKNPRRRKKIVTRFFCQSLAAISCGTRSALASARTKPTWRSFRKSWVMRIFPPQWMYTQKQPKRKRKNPWPLFKAHCLWGKA